MDSLGYDSCRMFNFGVDALILPPAVESQVYQTICSLAAFYDDMAEWYISTFTNEPIILISAPSIEMCERYKIPARRSFVLRALGRIIENIGPEYPVGIVDCKHDPINDPVLAAQANHWVQKFADYYQMPSFLDGVATFTNRSI